MKQIYESPLEVFIVLELADGGELFDRIVKKGHYSEKEAARVLNQVLSALQVRRVVLGQFVGHYFDQIDNFAKACRTKYSC